MRRNGITSAQLAIPTSCGSNCGNSIKMNKFILCALLPLALAAPQPSGGYGYAGYGGPAYAQPAVQHGPACRTEYETLITKQCATSYEKACRTETKTKYKTEYDTQCETISMKQCAPVARQVPDQVCATRYEQVCTQDTQKTYDLSYEENCQDIAKQVCAPAAVGVGYGHARYGRSAEPSGYGPKCSTITERVCSKQPVKTPRYVNVPKCSKVPKTECQEITRTVTDTKCVDVPQQKCNQVPRQAAFEVPLEICENIPRENCVDVPKKVPKQVCKEYKH